MSLARAFKCLALKQHLTEEAARLAVGALLDGGVPELEQGALLALLNDRRDDRAELAGGLAALSTRSFTLKAAGTAVRPVVLGSCAGTAGAPNLLPLLALSLRRLHVPVVMHGALSASRGVLAARVLRELGILPCVTLTQAQGELDGHGFAFVPTAVLAPGLAHLLALRERLGFGAYAERLARFVDPFAGASLLVVGAADAGERRFLHGILAERQGACLLLEAAHGDAFADPHHRPALELIRDAHAEVLFEADVPAARPAAGAVCGDDARSTAAWTRAVLHGHSPMPLPIVNQVACCLYGAGYTVDMNQAKAIAAVQTGSLLAA